MKEAWLDIHYYFSQPQGMRNKVPMCENFDLHLVDLVLGGDIALGRQGLTNGNASLMEAGGCLEYAHYHFVSGPLYVSWSTEIIAEMLTCPPPGHHLESFYHSFTTMIDFPH